MDRESATVKLVEIQQGKSFKEVLRDLYVDKHLSIEAIARILSESAPISSYTVWKYLHRYGIPVRQWGFPGEGVVDGGR